MATLSSTTLNGAVTATAPSLYLTSATGVAVGTVLFCEREAMRVSKIDGTKATVQRGWGGSRVSAHPTLATVYHGTADQFYQANPVGAIAAADVQVTPWINVTTGQIWTAPSGVWVETAADVVDLSGSTGATTGILPAANGGTGAASLGAARIPTSGLAAYPKTTAGAQTLAAAATGARNVVILATVTEVFADGNGGQSTFKIGETSTDDKFAATAVFTNAAAGTTVVRQGTLTSAKALLVTGAAATGTGTGAITVSYFFLPAA